MKSDIKYFERNDVKSDDDKLMRENGLSWFHRRGWTRKCVSNEKYKEVYRWTTDKNNIVYTYIVMRKTDYDNVFVNIDGYNEWMNKDIKLYFILADIRKSVSPKWLDADTIRGVMLKHARGTTDGILIPDRLFSKFPELKNELEII